MADQHFDRQLAVDRADDPDAGTRILAHLQFGGNQCRLGDQIGFRQHDQIGAGDLVLEQFRQRRLVIQHRIGPALLIDRRLVGGKPAGRHRRRIDQRYDAVDRYFRLDLRPGERPHQRLRQRQDQTSR